MSWEEKNIGGVRHSSQYVELRR